MLPLASLILVAALIEILEIYLGIARKKAECKTAYSLYLELLAMYKLVELTKEEIIKKENELRKTLQFFPRK